MTHHSWKDFPQRVPNSSGYYLTYYYNVHEDKYLYKCLWWHESEAKWCWRTPPEVLAFVEETKNNYYIPCLEYAVQNVHEEYHRMVPTYVEEKAILERLIEEHPDKIEAIKNDHRKTGWLVGQIMKAVKGQSNPNAIYKIVVDRLDM